MAPTPMRHILLWLLALTPILPALHAQTATDKLSQPQQQHLALYIQTQKAVRDGKIGADKIFAVFYGPVHSACQQSHPQILRQAETLRERANAAMDAGKTEPAARMDQAATLYFSMADQCQDIALAFSKVNTGLMRTAVSTYVQLETELRQLRLPVPERHWLSLPEADALYLAWLKGSKGGK